MGYYKWFGNLEITGFCNGPTTRLIEERLKKYYGIKKSRVSNIDRNDLCWMLKGFFDSFKGRHDDDYEICIIPDEYCTQMMYVTIYSGCTLKDFSVKNISYFALKTQSLLGTPTDVIEWEGKIYFRWYRNLLSTF